MFSGCSGLTGDLPSDYFSGCTALKNINGHFNECSGITGSIRTSIWSDCNNIETCASLFNGCTGLGGIAGEMQEIPRDFFRGKFNLTDASYMFNRCENLTFALMPEKENDNPWFVDCRKLFKINGIFANCKQCYSAIPSRLFEVWDNDGNPIDTFMTEASGVFSGCSLLVDGIPENLFDKFIKVRDLSNFFNGCVNLTGGIPDKLFANCYSLAYVDGMFQNCVKLGRYVEDITEQSPYFCSEELLWNCTNLVSASSMFNMGANGTRLRGEIPPLLFRTCSKLSRIDGIFGWCNLLTGTLDAQLFANNGNLTNVNNAFRGCGGLNEISGLLFSNSKNPKITNFDETFRGCGNLTGSAPTLWSQFANAEGLYCFNGCTKLDNYDEIPEQWK